MKTNQEIYDEFANDMLEEDMDLNLIPYLYMSKEYNLANEYDNRVRNLYLEKIEVYDRYREKNNEIKKLQQERDKLALNMAELDMQICEIKGHILCWHKGNDNIYRFTCLNCKRDIEMSDIRTKDIVIDRRNFKKKTKEK